MKPTIYIRAGLFLTGVLAMTIQAANPGDSGSFGNLRAAVSRVEVTLTGYESFDIAVRDAVTLINSISPAIVK